MVRTVADTALYMSVLSKPDRRDTMALPPADIPWMDLDRDVKGLKIGLWSDVGFGQAGGIALLGTLVAAPSQRAAFQRHAQAQLPVVLLALENLQRVQIGTVGGVVAGTDVQRLLRAVQVAPEISKRQCDPFRGQAAGMPMQVFVIRAHDETVRCPLMVHDLVHDPTSFGIRSACH